MPGGDLDFRTAARQLAVAVVPVDSLAMDFGGRQGPCRKEKGGLS